MFVDFDSVFHPTEEQKRRHRELINDILRQSLKNNGECCCNCKHYTLSNIGHGQMLPRCNKTREWIKEDIKCERYEFCGFIKEKTNE